jgi:hypothetical protein
MSTRRTGGVPGGSPLAGATFVAEGNFPDSASSDEHELFLEAQETAMVRHTVSDGGCGDHFAKRVPPLRPTFSCIPGYVG